MTASNAYSNYPNLHSVNDDGMQQWVMACVVDRKNGASPDELARLCKVLKRLAPALAAAQAAPEAGADFDDTLHALRAVNHG